MGADVFEYMDIRLGVVAIVYSSLRWEVLYVRLKESPSREAFSPGVNSRK